FFFASRRRHTRFSPDWSSDVCSSDVEFFTFRNSDYKNIRLASGETAQLPSVMGPNVEGPELEILEDGEGPNRQVLASFRSIQGLGLKDEIGINAVPAPMAQLGIGIAKN